MQDTALNHAEQLFAEGDVNGDGTLNCEEVIALMLKVSIPAAIVSPCGYLAALPAGCLTAVHLACFMPVCCKHP